MTPDEVELWLVEVSLRPAPTDAAIVLAMFVVAIIFSIFGWVIGWTMCLMAHKEFRSGAKR